MTLTEELTKKRENSSKAIPQDKYAIMQQSTEKLFNAKISEKAIKTGDILPDFQLPDEHGNPVSLNELLQNEYLIISFYRGGWCPYCNLELGALQQHLEEFKQLRANLAAISPETPDNSLTTSEKNELQFKVLSDVNNTYAKKLNLIFQMPENLKEVYHSFGLHVDKYNGNTDYELPMPATYVIDKNKTVVHHFISEDYTLRLDPKHILDFLKNR